MRLIRATGSVSADSESTARPPTSPTPATLREAWVGCRAGCAALRGAAASAEPPSPSASDKICSRSLPPIRASDHSARARGSSPPSSSRSSPSSSKRRAELRPPVPCRHARRHRRTPARPRPALRRRARHPSRRALPAPGSAPLRSGKKRERRDSLSSEDVSQRRDFSSSAAAPASARAEDSLRLTAYTSRNGKALHRHRAHERPRGRLPRLRHRRRRRLPQTSGASPQVGSRVEIQGRVERGGFGIHMTGPRSRFKRSKCCEGNSGEQSAPGVDAGSRSSLVSSPFREDGGIGRRPRFRVRVGFQPWGFKSLSSQAPRPVTGLNQTGLLPGFFLWAPDNLGGYGPHAAVFPSA